MAFKKGMGKVPGSGRKPGQKKVRNYFELLDSPGFSLREKIRGAVCSEDSRLITSLATLWKALAAVPAKSSDDDTEIEVPPDLLERFRAIQGGQKPQ